MSQNPVNAEMTRRSSGKIPALVIHAVLFYAFWAVWEVLLNPAMKSALGGGFSADVLDCCVKTVTWLIPALLLIRHFEPDCFVGLKQMFTEKVPIKWVLLWTLVFFLLSGHSFLKGLFGGTLHINPAFTFSGHVWLLIVGITEEAVFRGWMLNATAKDEKDWKMLLLNAVMFVCIHIPIWIHKDMIHAAFAGFGFVSIIVFSMLIGYCFLKHKNLLLPVFLHMLYDFMLEFFAA
jgi:membrane protease YdiL (CAAX protease family)